MKIQHTVTAAMLTSMLAFSPVFADDDEANEFEVTFIALNNSGVQGKAEIEKNGKQLTIKIKASGIEPGKPHPQHIHGHGERNENATCPTLIADTDGDGLVSVVEGLPDYGPIVLPLKPFDLVDEDGELYYKETFTVAPNELEPLHKRAIVLHGMTVNGTYIPSLPIACGQIQADD